MLGTYVKGGCFYSFYTLEENNDPPYLSVSGSILLWEVREKICGKPFLVSDELIEEMNVDVVF